MQPSPKYSPPSPEVRPISSEEPYWSSRIYKGLVFGEGELEIYKESLETALSDPDISVTAAAALLDIRPDYTIPNGSHYKGVMKKQLEVVDQAIEAKLEQSDNSAQMSVPPGDVESGSGDPGQDMGLPDLPPRPKAPTDSEIQRLIHQEGMQQHIDELNSRRDAYRSVLGGEGVQFKGNEEYDNEEAALEDAYNGFVEASRQILSADPAIEEADINREIYNELLGIDRRYANRFDDKSDQEASDPNLAPGNTHESYSASGPGIAYTDEEFDPELYPPPVVGSDLSTGKPDLPGRDPFTEVDNNPNSRLARAPGVHKHVSRFDRFADRFLPDRLRKHPRRAASMVIGVVVMASLLAGDTFVDRSDDNGGSPAIAEEDRNGQVIVEEFGPVDQEAHESALPNFNIDNSAPDDSGPGDQDTGPDPANASSDVIKQLKDHQLEAGDSIFSLLGGVGYSESQQVAIYNHLLENDRARLDALANRGILVRAPDIDDVPQYHLVLDRDENGVHDKIPFDLFDMLWKAAGEL